MEKCELSKRISKMEKEIRKIRKEFGLGEWELLLAVNRKKINALKR